MDMDMDCGYLIWSSSLQLSTDLSVEQLIASKNGIPVLLKLINQRTELLKDAAKSISHYKVEVKKLNEREVGYRLWIGIMDK